MDYEKEICELKKIIKQLQNKIEILEGSIAITTATKTHCGNCNTPFNGYKCKCNKPHEKECHLGEWICGREVCKNCSEKDWYGLCPYCYLEIKPYPCYF
jgi:hypothetical protein